MTDVLIGRRHLGREITKTKGESHVTIEAEIEVTRLQPMNG